MNSIDYLRGDRDVYVMGYANVGKSYLINSLIKKFLHKEEDQISTSPIPGTTLNSIKIHFFDDNKSIIDTPGLINENNTFSNLLPESYPLLLPKKEIKPITFQLNNDNLVYVGSILSFEVIEGDNVAITCYLSENVILHRRKIDGSSEFFEKHKGEILTPPSKEELEGKEFVEKIFILNKPYKEELYISGLGFISVNKNSKIKVRILKGIDVIKRYAILGN